MLMNFLNINENRQKKRNSSFHRSTTIAEANLNTKPQKMYSSIVKDYYEYLSLQCFYKLNPLKTKLFL